jgi:hypothetical protein
MQIFHERLACLVSFLGQQFVPATRNGSQGQAVQESAREGTVKRWA